MGIRNYLIEAYLAQAKLRSPKNCSGAATMPLMVTVNWKVKALVANLDEPVTFFCGGSRNFSKFIDLFDGVFVLEVDLDTLNRRLDERPENEWGGKKTERELIARLHQTKEDIPKNGIIIDATAHSCVDRMKMIGIPHYNRL